MRNRNTLGEHWKPSRGLGNSVERKTVTANHPNIIQTQSRHNSNHTNEQMAKTITQTLIKLPNQMKRSSISTSLKSNQKTLFSTISSFIYSIDRQFDQSNLDFDAIIQLLNFFGYPHTYSKTVFQPVGAPHTWHNCLQMMQFLAQIANYYFEYKMHLQQLQSQTQSTQQLIFTSFLRDDPSLIDQHYSNNLLALKKQNQELIYRIESSQLTLKNLKNSQKTLQELTEEQSLLLQKLQRENQNVIEIDQTNTQIIQQLQKVEDQIQENNLMRNTLLNKISMLEQEIGNQQLSAEEAQRIEYEIRDYHGKINKRKEEHEEHRNKYQQQKKQLLENFFTLQSEFSEIDSSIQKYANQLQARNIEMPRPHLNRNLFIESLNSQNPETMQQKLAESLNEVALKKMLHQQQSFLTILQVQIKHLSHSSQDTNFKKNNTDHELQSLNRQLDQLFQVDRENQSQNQELRWKIKESQAIYDKFKQDKMHLESKKESMIRQEQQLGREIVKRKEQLKDSLPKVKQYQLQTQKILYQMDLKINQTKNVLENNLERVYDQFRQLGLQIQDNV